jgi:hypothetical protein
MSSCFLKPAKKARHSPKYLAIRNIGSEEKDRPSRFKA